MLEQVRRGGARARPPRVRVGFWAGWFRAGLSLPGPGLPGERRRPPSPRRQARLRLRTQLPALGAATMARQVTTGRAARSAEEQGVYWVSRAAVWGCPRVPLALTTPPSLPFFPGQAAARDGDGAAAADPRQGGGEPRRGGGGDSAVVPEEGRAWPRPRCPKERPGCVPCPSWVPGRCWGHHHTTPGSHAPAARLQQAWQVRPVPLTRRAPRRPLRKRVLSVSSPRGHPLSPGHVAHIWGVVPIPVPPDRAPRALRS